MTNSTIGTVTAIAEELSDGSIQVGKILFNSNEMLGKGCEGTFVFKLVLNYLILFKFICVLISVDNFLIFLL